MKKISSKAYVRSPQSEYVRDRCELIKMLQLLGVITDVNMRMCADLDTKIRWAMIVECEVNKL